MFIITTLVRIMSSLYKMLVNSVRGRQKAEEKYSKKSVTKILVNLLKKYGTEVVYAVLILAGITLFLSFMVFTLDYQSTLSRDMSFIANFDFKSLRDEDEVTEAMNAQVLHNALYQRTSDLSYYQTFNSLDKKRSTLDEIKTFFGDKIGEKVLFWIDWDNLYIKDANNVAVDYLKPATGINAEDNETVANEFFRDYYGREEKFFLSPSLLSELNNAVFEGFGLYQNEKLKYPEHFTKPLYFVYDYRRLDEETGEEYVFVVERDEDGNIITDETAEDKSRKWSPSPIIYDYAVEKINDRELYHHWLENNSFYSVADGNVVEYATYEDEKGRTMIERVYYVLTDKYKYGEDVATKSKASNDLFKGPYRTFQDALNDKPLEADDKGMIVLENGSKVKLEYNEFPRRHFQLAPLLDKDGNLIAKSIPRINIVEKEEKKLKDSYINSDEYLEDLEKFAEENRMEINKELMVQYTGLYYSPRFHGLDQEARDIAVEKYEEYILEAGVMDYHWVWTHEGSQNQPVAEKGDKHDIGIYNLKRNDTIKEKHFKDVVKNVNSTTGKYEFVKNENTGTQNETYMWDQDIGKPIDRSTLEEVPLEIRSVRDWGLGSILSYIEGRKVEFNTGIYFDEEYRPDRVEEYFQERISQGKIAGSMPDAKHGFYPVQIVEEDEDFVEEYVLDPERTEYFLEMYKEMLSIPDNNPNIGKGDILKPKNHYGEEVIEVTKDGVFAKIGESDEKDFVRVFVPHITDGSLFLGLVGEDVGINEEFLNPVKFYLTWFDKEEEKESFLRKILFFIKDDGFIGADPDVGPENFSLREKEIKTTKKKRASMQYFSDLLKTDADAQKYEELLQELNRPFEYINPAWMDQIYLIEEALTFVGNFYFTYEDVVQKMKELDEYDQKRVLDAYFSNRYVMANKWDVNLLGKRYGITEVSGYDYNTCPDPYTLAKSLDVVAYKELLCEPVGNPDDYGNQKYYGKYAINYKEDDERPLSHYEEQVYRDKIFVERKLFLEDFPWDDTSYLSLKTVEKDISMYDLAGYKVVGEYTGNNDLELNVDLLDYSTIPYPDFNERDYKDLSYLYKGNHGFTLGFEVLDHEMLLVKEDRRYEGKVHPLYRNYKGHRKEIYPMEMNAYYNGEEFNSWQLRMTVEDKSPEEINEILEERMQALNYLEDYLMHFEAYVPYDVKDDKDLIARGSVGYGKILPNSQSSPTFTSLHLDKFVEETQKDYWKEVSGALDISEIDGSKYFAQLLQGIAEEEKKRVAKMMIAHSNTTDNPIAHKEGNITNIEGFVNQNNDLSIELISESSGKSEKYYMTHVGIMSLPYFEIPEEGYISTKNFGYSIEGTNDVSLSVGGEDDERLNDRKSINFAGVKFAKLIKKYGSVSPAIYAYFSSEDFVDALITVTQSKSSREDDQHGVWHDPTEADIREALALINSDNTYLDSSIEIDIEYFSPNIVKNVLSYVTDKKGLRDIVYGSFSTTHLSNSIEIGQDKNHKYVSKAKKTHGDIVYRVSEEYDVDPDIVFAIMAQESWGGELDTTGEGWGPMQIEDTRKDKTVPAERCSGGTNEVCVLITKDKKTDERLDPEKSIRWGVAHLKYLLGLYDGDYFKALTAYNMGTGAMDKLLDAYPNDWMDNIDKIPELLGKKKHGDPDYLANVLKYYAGNNLESITINTYQSQKVGNVNLKKLFNTIDLLIGKDAQNYYQFDKSGVDLHVNHLKAEESHTILAKSAGHRVDDINVTGSDFYFTILDFLGNPFNTSSIGGALFGGNSTALNLEDFRPYIYNIDTYVTPVNGDGNGFVRISSGYGWRRIDVYAKQRKFHHGIDIAYPTGTEIFAIADGTVIRSGNIGGYGLGIYIAHPINEEGTKHIISIYGHNSRLLVKEGDQVKAGQKIALMGSTGVSSGPHLHFEIRTKWGNYSAGEELIRMSDVSTKGYYTINPFWFATTNPTENQMQYARTNQVD